MTRLALRKTRANGTRTRSDGKSESDASRTKATIPDTAIILVLPTVVLRSRKQNIPTRPESKSNEIRFQAYGSTGKMSKIPTASPREERETEVRAVCPCR